MQGHSFHTFRFSAYEVLAGMTSLAGLAVGITLWSMTTFQTKEASNEKRAIIDRRLDQMESEVRQLNNVITGVAIDVSYIRGRMAPEKKKEGG